MSAKPAFAHSFDLLKIQCVHIVSRIENANYDSASSTGSHASYTEHDGITEYPDYRPSHSPTGSDTPERLIIDEMQALQWHEPDDDFANSTHIIDLKKQLDRAWLHVDNSDEFLTDISAARAASAWLMCTLLQANFAQASPQLQQKVMDLTSVVDRINNKLTAVERKRFLNENEMRSAFLDHSAKISGYLKEMTESITQAVELANTERHEMNKNIHSLELRLNYYIESTKTEPRPKNKYRFWAEMPPETHTLPALLERLGRPDTQ